MQASSASDEVYTTLSEIEQRWVERQAYFESHGYMFRPRLRPGWVPSWRQSGKKPYYCEDTLSLPSREHLVDATRMKDGKLVYIKRVRTGDLEMQIATLSSSEPLRDDPRNHAVPILEVLQDDEDETISYLVMPFFHVMNDLPFQVVDEVLEFVDQILEGLAFLHENNIAHRDCSYYNLMMDATSMYPKGFHPVAVHALPQHEGFAPYVSRSSAPTPVRYYFVDFGISILLDNAPERLVTGFLG